MQVRRIRMQGFTCHQDTEVDLPETGIVLVTGPNGSGKSSFPEAVATAGWGKTLRGTLPWVDGAEGSVVVETAHCVITRTRSAKGAGGLSWQPLEGKAFDFQGSPIAQERLTEEIGAWDVWKRVSVFSSQDAAHFTLATDAERKRLIESLLGIDKFDAALKLCRDDQKLMNAQLQRAERDLAVADAKVLGVEERKVDAERVLAAAAAEEPEEPKAPVSVDALREKDKRLYDMACATENDVDDARGRARAADAALATARARAAAAEERAQLLDVDSCPTCEQQIPAGVRDSVRTLAEAAKAEAAAQAEKCSAEHEALQEELEELLEEHRAFEEQRNILAQQMADVRAAEGVYTRARAEYERAVARKQQAQETVNTVDNELAAARHAAAKIREGLADARVQAAELDAVERVLGLQGFRAQVLSRALGGIEAVANRWLADIAGPGFHLEMKPYSEKAKGGVNDKISLKVHGAGGGHGYKAASGGERRRLDVAVLLALAEVASAALQQEQGTLWFDEVLDALDDEGVEAVVSVLGRLAQERAVVVISHSHQLMQRLQPVLEISMKDGAAKARFM